MLKEIIKLVTWESRIVSYEVTGFDNSMVSKNFFLVKKAITKIRARRAGEAHDKALNKLADMYRKHRNALDWLEPAVKIRQKNMSIPVLASQFMDVEIYASQFELLTSVYLERILAFKRELFTWDALYSDTHPVINPILISKMTETVNAFCAQMEKVMPADPQALLDVQTTSEDTEKQANWRMVAAKITADFDALEASVSEQYRAALLADLADCRKSGTFAMKKFRTQTEANVTYAEEKAEIESKQIDAFITQMSTLKAEATQALRDNNEEKARDALMKRISIEHTKVRYENEAKAIEKLGIILKEILEESKRI